MRRRKQRRKQRWGQGQERGRVEAWERERERIRAQNRNEGGRERSLDTFGVEIKMGRTSLGGGRSQRVACNHSRKTQRPIKKLAIRRVDIRSEIHSKTSQYLAEGTGVSRLRRQFSMFYTKHIPFFTHHHLCRQGVVRVATRTPHSQGPVFIHAHCAEGGTRTKGQKRAKGDGSGIGKEGSSEDGKGGGRVNKGRIGNGERNKNLEGMGRGGELWCPPHQERIRIEDQILSLRARHRFLKKKVAFASSQQLRA